MNEAAPITWLIGEIDRIVASGANSTASAISSAVAPIAAVCFGIYIILITVNYLRGAETEPVIDFGMRCAGFAVVISMGINASNYSSYVLPIVTGLGEDLSNLISGGSASANSIDTLAIFYLKILEDGYESANSPIFPLNIGPMILYFLKCLIIAFGLIPFLVAATVCLVVAKVGSTIVAMVGPMYFCFLLFPATRQYFSAWLNTAFSYALIPLIVAVISTISVGISKSMLSSGGTLDDTSLKVVFLSAMGNLVLLFLLKQVSSLASSLSAGGINAAMPGSIGTLARSMRAGGAGTAAEIKGTAKAYQAYKSMRSSGGNISNNRRPG